LTRLTVTCKLNNIFVNPGGEIIAELNIGYRNNSFKQKHAIEYINISKIIKEWEK